MGFIYILTGTGCGKTATALGLALRSLGHNKKVIMIQFMKGRKDIGEYKIQKKLKNFKIFQFGRKEFIKPITKPQKIDFELAQKGLEFTKKVLKLKPDLLILDEINLAIKINLLNINKVIDLLKKVPKKTTILLTGRYAPKKLIKRADFVTEFKILKEPKKWPKAQKGIEY